MKNLKNLWENQLLNKLKNLEESGSGFYIETPYRTEHISLVCDPYPVICINGGPDGEFSNNEQGYKGIINYFNEQYNNQE
jgi:hypothetical protein